jgi:L-lactate dehydrogenase complex protein LldG
MSARDNILGRIRTALGRSRPMTEVEAAAMRAKLRNHARGPMPTMDWEPVARFRERCLSLSSTVDEVAGLDQVPHTVARYLAGNGLARACVLAQYSQLDWPVPGSPSKRDQRTRRQDRHYRNLLRHRRDRHLMLLSGPDTHPGTSLLPETHIALVPVARILRSMEDGWDLLREERGELPRQVTFVSGPSRTADIEMTLVLGIHGPYRVHIILVTG